MIQKNKKVKNKSNFQYLILYTIVFFITGILVYGRFWKVNNSFVWKNDGIQQHYIALVYYGKYLRQILHNVFITHTFAIPMFDLRIGYGSDILYTLHYYVMGDPFALFSVFVSEKNTEYLYQVLIFLRIFLAGLSFSYYCFKQEREKYATLIGAIVYIFCGYVLYAGVRHPYFLNPMIYLPFILCGIDKIFKKKKPYLFILSVALAAISNFYFFYMICIFIFLYAVFVYFKTEKKFNVKKILIWMGKFLGYYMVSILLAAPVLLPVLSRVIGSNRLGIDYAVPLFFQNYYYGKMVLGFCGFIQSSNWLYMAYTSVAFLAVILLLTTYQKYTLLKIGFVLLTVFLCIPYMGHMFNGFSYVTQRWEWAYSMLIAYIVTVALPELKNASIKKIVILVFSCVIWFALNLKILNNNELKSFLGEYYKYYFNNSLSCLIIMAVLCCCMLLLKNYKKLYYGSILVCTVIGVFLNANACYSMPDSMYINEFHKAGELYTKIKNQPSSVLNEQFHDVVRYDQLLTGEKKNNTMLNNRYSTQYYFSLSDSNICTFMHEMYLNVRNNFNYKDLDGRSILEMLASVKYFVIQDGNENLLPYQYRDNKIAQVNINNVVYDAYETVQSMSIGKMFYGYIPTTKYKKLGVLQKQEALLYGVVLDDSDYEEIKPVYTSQSIKYKVKCSSGVTQIDKNKFKVTDGTKKMSIIFNGLDQSETYLILKGMKYKGEAGTIGLKIKSNQVMKQILYITNTNNEYCGIDNYLINMGYTDQGQTKITVKFSKQGTYSFDDILIGCQPTEIIKEKTNECLAKSLQNVQVGTNTISGDIELDKKGILLLSIPYSDGFRAYVDGKKWKIKKADTMYMALELPKGKHDIVLKYRSPNSIKSLICFFIGIMLFISIVMIEKRNKSGVN